jgi:hypothetical protein
VIGSNKGGYSCVIKWVEKVTAEDIDASETVQDAIDNELYGEEEEDDVPF